MPQPAPALNDPLTERLARCYTGAVHDVLRAMGHDNCVLPHNLRPLDPALKVAGKAWTVSGHIDRTRSAHDTLVGWTTLLSKAPGACAPKPSHRSRFITSYGPSSRALRKAIESWLATRAKSSPITSDNW